MQEQATFYQGASNSTGSDSFGCRDVFFSIINKNLNKLEPVVEGFVKESQVLNRLVYELSVKQRDAVSSRGYIARELLNLLVAEVDNKLEFFDQMCEAKTMMTHSGMSRVRFMQSRLQEMRQGLKTAQKGIQVALSLFDVKNEVNLARNNEQLNRILLVLTLVTVLSMPFSVVGGIMGMNVQVPG